MVFSSVSLNFFDYFFQKTPNKLDQKLSQKQIPQSEVGD